jgi:acetylornithine/succinyldiaminopimelate/putrescine aminotransferase
MQPRHPLADTYEQILREQRPNLLRLYLNPYVAQTCFCLARYVQTTWSRNSAETEGYQSFLANSFDEALSGAIKLARYSASLAHRRTTCVIVDAADRIGPYAVASVAGGTVEFLPGIVVVGSDADLRKALRTGGPFGLVVFVAGSEELLDRHADALRLIIKRDAPLVITSVDRGSLSRGRAGSVSDGKMTRITTEIAPDIVVFDESFVDHAVPFSAFTARKRLYDHWNRHGKSTFHSTTYQPNTISTLHFMRCLAKSDAEFHASLTVELEKVHTNLGARADVFKRLYSPGLYRMIRTTGFDTDDVRAAGDFVFINGRRVFDAVSGVACSVRGHNPPTYAEEMEALASLPTCETELAERLRKLTGLEHVVPAVSGATAVENALKIALAAQFPKRHVLALKAGFGGKTLLALTGTANAAYKEHIEPLYADVTYIDPFAPDAEAQIEATFARHPIAVVQLELIQAVGGVRRIPEKVIRHLEACRRRWGCLLLVDEVQTGMYRTGPFTLSRAMGITPDLLLLGKSVSDMMFPFALTLYSRAVGEKLAQSGSNLPAALRERYGYVLGYRTALNVLRRAEELSLPERVAESGALFARLLGDGLACCDAVREARVFGLLIGIELDQTRWPRWWLRKRLYAVYLYGMLTHRRYPVLAGFCQYEPNVLKITPSLMIAPEEVRRVCATIIEVLKQPLHRLLAGVLFRSFGFWRTKHEHDHAQRSTDEPVAR